MKDHDQLKRSKKRESVTKNEKLLLNWFRAPCNRKISFQTMTRNGQRMEIKSPKSKHEAMEFKKIENEVTIKCNKVSVDQKA